MYLHIDAQLNITLRDQNNFKKFHLEIDVPKACLLDIENKLFGIAVVTSLESAVVSISSLRDWKEIKHKTTWLKSFEDMINKAKKYGWVPNDTDLKAHIVWSS